MRVEVRLNAFISCSGGYMLGPGGTGPQILPRLPTGSIVISLSLCCLPNDEGPGQAPNIFFLEPPLICYLSFLPSCHAPLLYLFRVYLQFSCRISGRAQGCKLSSSGVTSNNSLPLQESHSGPLLLALIPPRRANLPLPWKHRHIPQNSIQIPSSAKAGGECPRGGECPVTMCTVLKQAFMQNFVYQSYAILHVRPILSVPSGYGRSQADKSTLMPFQLRYKKER